MEEFFPFFNKPEINRSNEIPLYKEIKWDFLEDKIIVFNGEPLIIEGNEAIKVWIYKTLKTQRYNYDIYSWDYGCEINDLLGKGIPIDLVKSEVARFVEEALLINPYIISLSEIDVNFDKDKLTATFTVNTIYGEVRINEL